MQAVPPLFYGGFHLCCDLSSCNALSCLVLGPDSGPSDLHRSGSSVRFRTAGPPPGAHGTALLTCVAVSPSPEPPSALPLSPVSALSPPSLALADLPRRVQPGGGQAVRGSPARRGGWSAGPPARRGRSRMHLVSTQAELVSRHEAPASWSVHFLIAVGQKKSGEINRNH